jgi:hypothetical protein
MTISSELPKDIALLNDLMLAESAAANLARLSMLSIIERNIEAVCDNVHASAVKSSATMSTLLSADARAAAVYMAESMLDKFKSAVVAEINNCPMTVDVRNIVAGPANTIADVDVLVEWK